MTTVSGSTVKSGTGHHLTWDCPVNGIEMWAQGEFLVVDGKIQHEVTDEDERTVLYIVEATI